MQLCFLYTNSVKTTYFIPLPCRNLTCSGYSYTIISITRNLILL